MSRYDSCACGSPKKAGARQCRPCHLREVDDLPSRFAERVDRSGECWVWVGGIGSAGYGYIDHRGRRHSASRVALQLAGTEVPDGLFVLHHCDNPPCVRPDHLFVGTQTDNMADARRKGRLSPTIFDGTQVRLMLAARLQHPETAARGERVASAKLNEAAVREVRARLASGRSQRDLAAEFGVSRALIYAIAHRRIWRHVA